MSGTLRIRHLKFFAGTNSAAAPREIHPGTVVVLVGPNNSGKSMALREIEAWTQVNTVNLGLRVIKEIKVDFPKDSKTAERFLRRFEIPKTAGANIPDDVILMRGFTPSGQERQGGISTSDLQQHLDQADTNPGSEHLIKTYLSGYYTVRLDGRTRFSLVEKKSSQGLRAGLKNHLQSLLMDPAARQQLRELTSEAFGLYFVLDPTEMEFLQIRMSERPPADIYEEQGLDRRCIDFVNQAVPIQELSDGIQAFVGLLSAVLSLPHKIVLVDEPEAFLHPPLARRLGRNLVRIASDRQASLIAATHSAEFLAGCLEADAGATVVRLTYESGLASARSLAPAELRKMTTDPLLRSTGVLGALFHRAALITEADTDRAFYDETNRRLVAVGRGVSDAAVLNAQNWQTVHKLVGPLRSIGIPAAAILDLDAIAGAKTNWDNLMIGCGVSQSVRSQLEPDRQYLSKSFDGLPALPGGQKVLKAQGINALAGADLLRAQSFLGELARFGIFLVPGGQLESWLSHLGIAGHGPSWLIKVFGAIGSTEDEPNFVGPGSGDVWAFLDSVAAWVNNPKRAGVQ